MIEKFTLKRVNKTSARFDFTKLDWMNSKYIQGLPVEDLVSELRPYIKDANLDSGIVSDEWLHKLVELYKERFRTLPEFVTLTTPFFSDEIEYEDAAVRKHLKKGNSALIIDALKKLKEVKDFSSIEELESCLRSITTEHNIGFGKLAQPIRVALIGKSASAGIFETLELLGKDKTLKRLEHTINTFLSD
jgi:glutamyl/glutaminyl-tRNA synthetase